MGTSRATLHVAPMGSQAPQCLFCEAILDPSSHRGGKPQEFCGKKPCRRLFWQEARRVGGHLLRRRRRLAARRAAQGTAAKAVGKSKADTGRLVAFLAATGAVALGIGIPDVAQ